MTSNPAHPPAEVDDRAFAELLRQLDLPRHYDLAIAEIQQAALAVLIATYDPRDPDCGPARLVAHLIAKGADLQVLRDDFARAAGIADLELLRFFSTLDARLESGQGQTIDITDLADDELLRLFGYPGPG